MRKIKNSWILSVISAIFFVMGWPTFGHPIFLFFIFIPLFFIEEQINCDNKKDLAKKDRCIISTKK